MKTIAMLLLLVCNLVAVAQEDLTKLAQPIVAEGKRLYRSEMASWYGTDIFMERYKDRANIGGYFSYTKKRSQNVSSFQREPTQK